MTIEAALEDLEIAFLQLEFAIRMLSFFERERVDPLEFDTAHLVLLESGNLSFPRGHFADNASIIRAAGIHVLLAFGATSLVLDKAFETKGVNPDPNSADNDQQLRTLIYMVRCAHAHGISEPRWRAQGKYSRSITVCIEGIWLSLDLPTLNRQVFDIRHLGGYRNWYRIRDAALRELSS